MGLRGMSWIRTERRPRRWPVASAGIVVVLVVACGSGATGPPGVGATPAAIPTTVPPSSPAVAASTTPSSVPTPSTDSGLIVDRSFAWGTIAWSPSGDTLAAAALTQQAGQGEIHLFERSGRQAGVIPGTDLAWIDDDHLVVVQRNSDGVTSSARLWSKDARDSQLLAARMASILGNGHGAVAILFDDQDAATATYRLWTAGVLSKVRAGIPVAWSTDGRLLVVAHDPREASIHPTIATTGPGVILAASGSIPAWYEVIDYPTLHRVAVFSDIPVDRRFRPAVDAGGSRLAAIGDDGRVVVLGFAPRTIESLKLAARVLGWTLDGRLALEGTSPHVVRLWDPATRTLGQPLAPGARFALADGQIVTVPDPAEDPSPEVKTTGTLTPDGALRARTGPTVGDQTLRLLPEPVPPPAP